MFLPPPRSVLVHAGRVSLRAFLREEPLYPVTLYGFFPIIALAAKAVIIPNGRFTNRR